MRRLLQITAVLAAFVLATSSASALDLTDRQIDVSGKLSVSSAMKIAERLIKFDAQAEAPIYLLVSSTGGSAQGVMLLADAIRSLKSPVVAVVLTHLRGGGAAAPFFADRVLLFRSSGFVFTDVEYEGVKKPKKKDKKDDKKKDDKAKADKKDPKAGDKKEETKKPKDKEPSPEEKLLQQVREDYLKNFWAAVGKRIKMKPDAILKKIENEGGFVYSAAAAVKSKAAYGFVERITYTKLADTKHEYKVTTSEKKVRTAEPMTPPAESAPTPK